MVATASMVIFGFNLIFSIMLPVILLVVLRKKYNAAVSVFFIGAATFFVFALVLEQLFHSAVLMSPLGTPIQGRVWLTALYGGLAAGIFEETGRFLSMKFLLKGHYGNPYNALMFGAGHGGCEMLIIFGSAMLNNLIYSALINSGQTDAILALLAAEQQDALQAALETLASQPSYYFLLGDMERISAVISHIGLSILVWIAVTEGKTILYPLAVGLHFLLDFISPLLIGVFSLNTIAVELIIFALAVCIALTARYFWKRYE